MDTSFAGARDLHVVVVLLGLSQSLYTSSSSQALRRLNDSKKLEHLRFGAQKQELRDEKINPPTSGKAKRSAVNIELADLVGHGLLCSSFVLLPREYGRERRL